MSRLKIGLVLNPFAGMGGPTGLKGTDGMVDEAIRRGGRSRVMERVSACIGALTEDDIDWLTLPAEMGGGLLSRLGVSHRVVGSFSEGQTTAEDTKKGVAALEQEDIDLLMFAGGDGTARDVFDGHESCPAVLGIPCGVKMHSGVFATTPGAAAALIDKLVRGELLSVIDAEVRDIDENSFRQGIVKTRFYGELPIPDDLRYMQQTKVGGREVEELVIQELAADFIENMDPQVLYVMGSGSTVSGAMDAMGLNSTLLGIDVIRGGEIVALDVSEVELLQLLEGGVPARIIITAISGQGHILGRGNQQLSPDVIRQVGSDQIDILASKSKLAGLDRRPLLVDTGDEQLDAELRGVRTVLTGYEDRVLYRVA